MEIKIFYYIQKKNDYKLEEQLCFKNCIANIRLRLEKLFLTFYLIVQEDMKQEYKCSMIYNFTPNLLNFPSLTYQNYMIAKLFYNQGPSRIVLFVNLCLVELSCRFQTINNDSYISYVRFRKRSISIIVTRKSVRLFKTCCFLKTVFLCDIIILFI